MQQDTFIYGYGTIDTLPYVTGRVSMMEHTLMLNVTHAQGIEGAREDSSAVYISMYHHLSTPYPQGLQFKAATHTAMSSSSFYNKQMLPYYNKPDGQKLYDSLTREAMASFPQYVEEIQGLANGTGLPFYKVFVTLIVSPGLCTERPRTPHCCVLE